MMKNRKKSAAILAGMILVLQAAGCGNAEPPVNDSGAQSSSPASVEIEERDTISTEDGKILIAYFSAGENSDVDAVSSASVTTVDGEAKGRLRAVADMIQAETGGELFSIQTSVKYPGDGGELIDYVAKEQDEDARPELTSHIENPDDYDVIFVGFPNMEQGFESVLCA